MIVNTIDNGNQVSIKVIGVGGAGSNAVDRMIQVGIPAVEFVAANTDAQALSRCEAPHKVQLGRTLTRGLGAGGSASLGAEAAEQSRDELLDAVRGADMVFIAAGMGGGTGTGAGPVIARIARQQEALTIAVVSKPFAFEGGRRCSIAGTGIERLQEHVDTLVVVSNDRLLEVVDRHVSLDLAFRIADEVLRQGVQGISELVTRPGLINLDFADVRSVMDRGGGALVSLGHGEGKDKALKAAEIALRSPLLDIGSISGTDGLLVNITGGEDLTLAEVDSAMELLYQAAVSGAKVLFGVVIDPKMADRVQITLIATGLGAEKTIAAPLEEESVSLSEVFGEDLAVPAFMRSPAYAGAGWRN